MGEGIDAWYRELAEALRKSMKYCFHDGRIDDEEFYGTRDHPGMMDYVWSVVETWLKRAYIDGALSNVDMSDELMVLTAKHYAEKIFHEWKHRGSNEFLKETDKV